MPQVIMPKQAYPLHIEPPVPAQDRAIRGFKTSPAPQKARTGICAPFSGILTRFPSARPG